MTSQRRHDDPRTAWAMIEELQVDNADHDPDDVMAEVTAAVEEVRVGSGSEGGRKYRRTKGLKGPRLYRTRLDPFAEVWHEVEAELTAHPERTAKAAFAHLQERYPGVFPATQVRTLQRRVQEWRMRTVLAFDDQWLGEEVLVRRSFPLPLRAIVAGRAEGESGKINDEATAAAG